MNYKIHNLDAARCHQALRRNIFLAGEFSLFLLLEEVANRSLKTQPIYYCIYFTRLDHFDDVLLFDMA